MREISTPLSLRVNRSERDDEGIRDRPPTRVLVVDDEAELVRAMARILKARGFEVQTASNGMEALEILTKQTFDVMLVDLVMPGMSGLELLKRAKTLQEQLEVVMMTAYADVDTAVTSVKAGAYDFLTKPFDAGRLVCFF